MGRNLRELRGEAIWCKGFELCYFIYTIDGTQDLANFAMPIGALAIINIKYILGETLSVFGWPTSGSVQALSNISLAKIFLMG